MSTQGTRETFRIIRYSADLVAGHAAFTELVDQHSSWVRAVVWSFFHDGDTVDDITQTIWCNAYLRRHTYAGRGHPRDWLRTITRRACLMELRRVQLNDARFRAVSKLCRLASSDCPASRAEIRSSVRSAMRLLSERERSVVASRLIDDLSTAQTASRLSYPEGTVKALLFRGKKKMRVELAAWRPEYC